VVSHPFAGKKAKGWGTERFLFKGSVTRRSRIAANTHSTGFGRDFR